MNENVDLYLEEGCGRCPLYRTPQCKVHTWSGELKQLRRIVLECGLEETFKWSQPCYVHGKSNVLIVTAFKEYASISFFKGSLLADPGKILVAPGPNSQSARQIRLKGVEEILEKEAILKAYIFGAIEIERMGLKVSFNKEPLPVPLELQRKFEEIPGLKSAFEALTPGRQRGYILYFTQAKQSQTRVSRIERNMAKILSGKGL